LLKLQNVRPLFPQLSVQTGTVGGVGGTTTATTTFGKVKHFFT
jgi:hypothetical protein